MTNPLHRGKAKQISSTLSTKRKSDGKENRFAMHNAGPSVSQGGAKLVGKTVNEQTRAPMTSGTKRAVDTNVVTEGSRTGTEPSMSDITSAASQFNTYRFHELSAIGTYKKMMTIHLKDIMFRKLKFITSGEMMEFSRHPASLCGFVCGNMQVAPYQWGEYWDMVKQPTKKMIEQQRTNATSAIKKGFRGKYEETKKSYDKSHY